MKILERRRRQLDSECFERRVIVIANTDWYIYNFRQSLIRELNRVGFSPVVVAPDNGYANRLRAAGIRFVPMRMDNKGTSLIADTALLWRLNRLFRKERPWAILSYTPKPNIYASLAAIPLRIPVVNNVSGLGTAFIRESWLTLVVKVLYRFSFAFSFSVFFQNEDDRTLFVERRIVDRAKTRLLPGSGIDVTRYQPEPLPSEQQLGGEGRAPTLLLIARLLWDKGVGEFVEAARIVGRHRPGARFQILGFLDVENRTAIDRATVDRWVAGGVVEYLGATDDVRPFIAAADCVVLPSYREGTPRTLLEGAAMGRPLIATDVPGCREVVEDGRNGLLCNVRDAADLAEKMLRMIDMSPAERARMGRAGREKVEREFDEKIVIDRYMEVIDQILVERAATVPWHRRFRSRLPFAKKVRPHRSAIPTGEGMSAGNARAGAKNPTTTD